MRRTPANVVGVGSTLMSDDGVGPAAIARLSARGVAAGVELHDAGLALSDVLGTLDPSVPLIVVDAVRGGGPPGTIYEVRLDSGTREVVGADRMTSLHELSVLPALRLEALTGRVFADVTVFGVEPEKLEWGEGLSPAVDAALDKVVDAVLKHVETKCASTTAGDRHERDGTQAE